MGGLIHFFYVFGWGIYLIWLLYSRLSFYRLISRKIKKETIDYWPTVTIVVPVRNEREHFPQLVSDLCTQNYPEGRFEIFIVDDHSSPPVEEILKNCEVENSSVNVYVLPASRQGKKQALQEGIHRAEGEWIVATDADSRRGTHWLRTLIRTAIFRDLRVVTGPVFIHPVRSWIGTFERLEQAVLTAVSATGIENGSLPLCSGANLAFEKAFFEEVGGYRGNERIASGDDVFLMKKFLSRDPRRCGYALEGAAAVCTPSNNDLDSYIRQRARWAGKNKSVGDVNLIVQSMLPAFGNFLVLAGLTAWLFGVISVFSILLPFLAKVVLEGLWSRAVFYRLDSEPPPLVDIFKYALFYPFFSAASMIIMAYYSIRTQYWKGRRIRSN